MRMSCMTPRLHTCPCRYATHVLLVKHGKVYKNDVRVLRETVHMYMCMYMWHVMCLMYCNVHAHVHGELT